MSDLLDFENLVYDAEDKPIIRKSDLKSIL